MVAAQIALLAVGAVLMFLAERRGWRPALRTAIVVAIGLRVLMAFMSSNLHPYDFSHDFIRAAQNMLAHQDLILHTRDTGWNYLPVYAWPLAGMYWLTKHQILPWFLAGKIVPIAADTILAVLVGKLAVAFADPGEHPGPRGRGGVAAVPVRLQPGWRPRSVPFTGSSNRPVWLWPWAGCCWCADARSWAAC